VTSQAKEPRQNPTGVVLARPHRLIIGPMQNILRRNGFSPIAINKGSELNTLEKDQIAAAVISTAVVSPVSLSYEQVYARVRNAFGSLPVLFATMMDVDIACKVIARETQKTDACPVKPLGEAVIGNDTTVAVVSKTELIKDEQTGALDAHLKTFFTSAAKESQKLTFT